jgi:hypothetical protein
MLRRRVNPNSDQIAADEAKAAAASVAAGLSGEAAVTEPEAAWDGGSASAAGWAGSDSCSAVPAAGYGAGSAAHAQPTAVARAAEAAADAAPLPRTLVGAHAEIRRLRAEVAGWQAEAAEAAAAARAVLRRRSV